MISFAQCLPIGDAIRLIVLPPAGAERLVLLRKIDDSFTGHDDPAALPVIDTDYFEAVVDDQGLIEGNVYFYRLYSLVAGAWQETATTTVTARSTYRSASVDVLGALRQRLINGLRMEVKAGRVVSSPNSSIVKVELAFPFNNPTFPIVTIHLTSQSDGERSLGESMIGDSDFDGIGSFEASGWFENVQLDVIAWTQNPEGRNDLRKSIRRVIMANLEVFGDYGMDQIGFTQTDTEQPTENAWIYQSVGSFRCVIPNRIGGDSEGNIVDIDLDADSLI